MAHNACSVPECDRLARQPSGAMCSMHGERLRLHGTTDNPRPSAEERFWPRVEKTDDCWIWKAAIGPTGYGVFFLDGRNRPAHRVAYAWMVGEIPDGLVLDHTCHNRATDCSGGSTCIHRACVNPAHLEPKTLSENFAASPLTLQSINAAKTHCPQGHEYSAENTSWKGAQRRCITCRRETAKRIYYRSKVAS